MRRTISWLPLCVALCGPLFGADASAQKPAPVAPAAPARVSVGAELVISARGVRSYSVQQADHLVDLTADAEHFTFTGRVPGKVQLITIGADGVSKSIMIDVVAGPPGPQVDPFATPRADVMDPFGMPRAAMKDPPRADAKDPIGNGDRIDPFTSRQRPAAPPKTAAARKALLARVRAGTASESETRMLRAACKQVHDPVCVAAIDHVAAKHENGSDGLGY